MSFFEPDTARRYAACDLLRSVSAHLLRAPDLATPDLVARFLVPLASPAGQGATDAERRLRVTAGEALRVAQAKNPDVSFPEALTDGLYSAESVEAHLERLMARVHPWNVTLGLYDRDPSAEWEVVAPQEPEGPTTPEDLAATAEALDEREVLFIHKGENIALTPEKLHLLDESGLESVGLLRSLGDTARQRPTMHLLHEPEMIASLAKIIAHHRSGSHRTLAFLALEPLLDATPALGRFALDELTVARGPQDLKLPREQEPLYDYAHPERGGHPSSDPTAFRDWRSPEALILVGKILDQANDPDLDRRGIELIAPAINHHAADVGEAALAVMGKIVLRRPALGMTALDALQPLYVDRLPISILGGTAPWRQRLEACRAEATLAPELPTREGGRVTLATPGDQPA
jgi:hypothetical protein